MNYRKIDMESFPRREHFEHFMAYANPYAAVTVEIDITGALARIKAEKRPFYITMLYFFTKAANAVPQMRQRVLDGEIIEYDRCESSYTCDKGDGTYCNVPTYFDEDLDVYTQNAKLAQKKAIENPSIADGEDPLGRYFTTSTPWFTPLHVQHPTPIPADTNPRFLVGKYHQAGGRILMPINIVVNHALCDGFHIAQVISGMEQGIKEFGKEYEI